LKLGDNSNAWDWYKMKPSLERDIMVEEASKELLKIGWQCPTYRIKDLALIPIYIWLLFFGFIFLYTFGRMITIFGKRLCE